MWSRRAMRFLLLGLLLTGVAALGNGCPGLRIGAYAQLARAGVNQYLGHFTPASSTPVGDGWTRHDFDPQDGDGPICIAGTPYSIFSRAGDPSKLLIFEQGGGACWQDFYNCNITVENNPLPPIPSVDAVGLWNHDNPGNPFADYSVVYMPYCDGSVFSGDNDVADPNFPFGPVRHHRGMRNQSAGVDLAKALFPNAEQITVAGPSAGGVGAAGFAPFLVRFLFGNGVDLTVFNDAGPVAVNLDPSQTASIAARANDWQFGKFYPASCNQCDDLGQATAVIDWRLMNDTTIRESIYETDGDLTNRFFLGLLGDQPAWRNLIVTAHGLLNADYPNRYKRFFVSGDTSHTALQTILFYTQTANGVPLNEWAADFVNHAPGWIDIVEAP
jgi:Pectinacetylesterase